MDEQFYYCKPSDLTGLYQVVSRNSNTDRLEIFENNKTNNHGTLIKETIFQVSI